MCCIYVETRHTKRKMVPRSFSNPATAIKEKTTACCPLMQLLLVGHTWCITRLLHKNPRSANLAWPRDGLLKLPLRRRERRGRWKSRKDTHDGRRHIGRSVFGLSFRRNQETHPWPSTLHPNNPLVRAPAPTNPLSTHTGRKGRGHHPMTGTTHSPARTTGRKG